MQEKRSLILSIILFLSLMVNFFYLFSLGLDDEDNSYLIENYIIESRAYLDKPSVKYLYARVDLNGDSKEEMIFLMNDFGYFCGNGGCNLLIFASDKRLISNFTISNEPIYYSKNTTQGWNDLIISSEGRRSIRFDGKYYPTNPTLEPIATEAQVRQAIRIVFQKKEFFF